MRNLDLNIAGVADIIARDNFDAIQEVLLDQPFLKFKGRHIELEFDRDTTNLKYKHNFAYRPRDVIVTSTIGTGTLTWNYGLFDRDYLDLTVAGTSASDPLVVRAFVGTYLES